MENTHLSKLDKVIAATLGKERELQHNSPGVQREITHEQWLKEGRDRFGPDMSTWKFICPSCNFIASVADYNAARAKEGHVGYSCIGRLIPGTPDSNTFSKNGGPCLYSGGGLLRLNPVRVVMPTGHTRDAFEWAPIITFGTGYQVIKK